MRDERIHSLRTMRSTKRQVMTPERFVRGVRHRMGQIFDMPEGVAEGAPVVAEVNPVQHLRPGNWIARWIVICDCCGGAEDVDPDEPVFFCCSCFNEEHYGQWRPVLFPAERERVERLLMERPHARVRGATAGQAVSEIEAENRAIERAGGRNLDWRDAEAAVAELHQRIAAGMGRAR